MEKVKHKRRRSINPYAPEKERPILDNFFKIFVGNFGFIPFFLPSLFCAYMFLAAGGWIAFVGAFILLIPVGPAIVAEYDIAFRYCSMDPSRGRRTFLQSYKLNFKQGCLTMAVMLPFLYVLVMKLFLQNRPQWMLVTLFLGAYVLMEFSILAFAQIALVDMKLTQIWKNAIFMIPLAGKKGIIVTLVHLIFIAVLYKWISVTFLAFLILGPALLVTWSARELFSKLKELLVRDGGDNA